MGRSRENGDHKQATPLKTGLGGWVYAEIPVLPSTGPVPLDKLLHLSVPQISHLRNGDNNHT